MNLPEIIPVEQLALTLFAAAVHRGDMNDTPWEQVRKVDRNHFRVVALDMLRECEVVCDQYEGTI